VHHDYQGAFKNKGEKKMREEETEGSYPLRSLHDFLSELDREWDSFRTASLIGMVAFPILLIFVAFRFLVILFKIRRQEAGLITVLDEIIFLILVAVFVVYEITLLVRQYKFFKKWERRVGLLLHLEERLIGEIEKSRLEEPSRSMEENSHRDGSG